MAPAATTGLRHVPLDERTAGRPARRSSGRGLLTRSWLGSFEASARRCARCLEASGPRPLPLH